MSELKRDKLQKIVQSDRKLTENVRIDSNLSKVTKFVDFLSIFYHLSRLDSDMFCQFGHCFLVVRWQTDAAQNTQVISIA